MAKYRKKPVVIEATQWFRNGDHPYDAIFTVKPEEGGTFTPDESEGKVVRYYRCPQGIDPCTLCGAMFNNAYSLPR